MKTKGSFGQTSMTDEQYLLMLKVAKEGNEDSPMRTLLEVEFIDNALALQKTQHLATLYTEKGNRKRNVGLRNDLSRLIDAHIKEMHEHGCAPRTFWLDGIKKQHVRIPYR